MRPVRRHWWGDSRGSRCSSSSVSLPQAISSLGAEAVPEPPTVEKLHCYRDWEGRRGKLEGHCVSEGVGEAPKGAQSKVCTPRGGVTGHPNSQVTDQDQSGDNGSEDCSQNGAWGRWAASPCGAQGGEQGTEQSALHQPPQ